MDEATPSGPPAPPAPLTTGLRIDRIYLRDLSFESPQAPGVFASEWRPQFQIELNTRANRLDDGRFEVVLMVNLEAKSDESTLFMVELQQAGIFPLRGDGRGGAPNGSGDGMPRSAVSVRTRDPRRTARQGHLPAVHARAGELRHPLRGGEEASRVGAGHRLMFRAPTAGRRARYVTRSAGDAARLHVARAGRFLCNAGLPTPAGTHLRRR